MPYCHRFQICMLPVSIFSIDTLKLCSFAGGFDITYLMYRKGFGDHIDIIWLHSFFFPGKFSWIPAAKTGTAGYVRLLFTKTPGVFLRVGEGSGERFACQ